MFQLRRTSILLALALTAAPSAWAELQATGEPPAAKQGWKAITVAEGVRQLNTYTGILRAADH